MQPIPGGPGIIDQSVGARIRARRRAMDMSVEALARMLGCTPELMLRYESGEARVGAVALLKLTRICGVEVGYFLADLSGAAVRPSRRGLMN